MNTPPRQVPFADPQAAPALQQCRVLLTRPAGQVERLAQAIADQGGHTLSLPLLSIAPVQERDDIERVKSRILALDTCDIAIFISTNAAHLGLEWIESYWPQLPVGLEAYAVGPGTAAVLRQHPWPVHCADTGVTSEDLLALPGLQRVQGKRIALFRGKGGRELLAETLRERGAQVDYIELYTRQVPAHTRADVLAALETQRINCVVLTSLQIFESFLSLLKGPETTGAALDLPQDTAANPLLVLQQTLTLIVPSARVEQNARRAGFAHVLNVGGADDLTVLACLRHCPATHADPQEAL